MRHESYIDESRQADRFLVPCVEGLLSLALSIIPLIVVLIPGTTMSAIALIIPTVYFLSRPRTTTWATHAKPPNISFTTFGLSRPSLIFQWDVCIVFWGLWQRTKLSRSAARTTPPSYPPRACLVFMVVAIRACPIKHRHSFVSENVNTFTGITKPKCVDVFTPLFQPSLFLRDFYARANGNRKLRRV